MWMNSRGHYANIMGSFSRIVVSWVFLAGLAHSTTVHNPGIEGLTWQSARVVVADVVGQRTVVERSRAATRIRTETTLSVTTALTGPVGPAQVTLSQPGGVAMVDGAPRRHEVHGAAHFEPGERVLVFLESARADQLVVSGMALGKFTVAPDAVTGELMAVRAPSAELAANPAPPTPAEPSLGGPSPSDSARAPSVSRR